MARSYRSRGRGAMRNRSSLPHPEGAKRPRDLLTRGSIPAEKVPRCARDDVHLRSTSRRRRRPAVRRPAVLRQAKSSHRPRQPLRGIREVVGAGRDLLRRRVELLRCRGDLLGRGRIVLGARRHLAHPPRDPLDEPPHCPCRHHTAPAARYRPRLRRAPNRGRPLPARAVEVTGSQGGRSPSATRPTRCGTGSPTGPRRRRSPDRRTDRHRSSWAPSWPPCWPRRPAGGSTPCASCSPRSGPRARRSRRRRTNTSCRTGGPRAHIAGPDDGGPARRARSADDAANLRPAAGIPVGHAGRGSGDRP